MRGDPVAGSLIPEELAPAADADTRTLPLAVGHRTGTADDVYSVGRAQGARPAADHVVDAEVAVLAECGQRDRVQRVPVGTDFAVAGQADHSERDRTGRNPGLPADVVHTVGERPGHSLDAETVVVAARLPGPCQHGALCIDEDERRLGAPAVDAQERAHATPLAAPSRGCSRTPFTTRLTLPLGNGLSGVVPTRRANESPRI